MTGTGSIDDAAAVDLLLALCGVPSVSGEEAPAVALLVDRARAAGMRATVDGAGNFVAGVGRGEPAVVLLGHIDTVAGWIPPRLEGGVLHGRGTVDAKGPLTTFLVAASRLASLDHGAVVVVGAVEEEAPSSRGARGVVPQYAPAFAVIGEPSGAASMTLGYKGRVGFRLHGSRAHAHSAGAEPSVASDAAGFWSEAGRFCGAFNRDRSIFARIDPHLAEFNTATDGLEDTVTLRGSFRLPVDAPLGELERALRASAAGWGRLELHDVIPAWRGGKRNALVRAFLQSIRSHGLDPRFTLKTGTSDMNIVGPAWDCPIVAYGPGDSSLDHAPNEHVAVEEYLAAIQVMTGVLERLLGQPGRQVLRSSETGEWDATRP